MARASWIQWLQRTERDRLALAEPGAERAKSALFLALSSSLAVLAAPVLIGHAVRWNQLHPEVPLARDSSWRVLYEDSAEECPSRLAASPRCPAHPSNPNLWQSVDARFPDLGHKQTLRSRVGKAFWLGTVIPRETVGLAARQGAHILMLGHFWSRYEVWIEGKQIVEGPGVSDPTPILIPLPRADLLEGRPLHVAIRAWHEGEYPTADHLLCEALPAGFVTQESAAGYVTLVSFWERARPYALTLAYSLIAALFFFFWLPTPSRQEYSYLALFAISGAAYQGRWTDLFYWNFDRANNLMLDLFVNTYAAGFAMLLGFAFARLRRSVFRIAVPAVIALPVLLAWVFPTIEERFEARRFLYLWIEPGAFLAGGLACLVQAWHLRGSGTGRIPHRIRRLALFGAGMLAAAGFYFVLKRGLYAGPHGHFWHGFEHLGLMLFFAGIALREYGEHQAILRRSPVSDYHRRPVLPQRIDGTLLALDLKSSEPFYRLRARTGGEDLVALWRSHVSSAISRGGGTIVLRKGDEIIAFFEGVSMSRALGAVEAAAVASELLAEEQREQDHFPREVPGFHFRAALCRGSIRPTWEQVGALREPYWEGAGETNPFVDGARLLELEKHLKPGRTRLVMEAHDASALIATDPGRLEPRFTPGPSLLDKHGEPHKIMVYLPANEMAASDTDEKIAA